MYPMKCHHRIAQLKEPFAANAYYPVFLDRPSSCFVWPLKEFSSWTDQNGIDLDEIPEEKPAKAQLVSHAI